jgi:hypothetical protein
VWHPPLLLPYTLRGYRYIGATGGQAVGEDEEDGVMCEVDGSYSASRIDALWAEAADEVSP